MCNLFVDSTDVSLQWLVLSLVSYCPLWNQHICMRQVTARAIYSVIAYQGVTHFCAAPTVLNSIVNANSNDVILPLPRTVKVMTAGAAPPPSILASMSNLEFCITHIYGLSETYGLSTVCAWKPEWDKLSPEACARQGVRYIGLEGLDVVNMKTMSSVPADGKTIGEIVLRGNAVMKGYLKNPKANEEAFKDGWYHSGDLGVKHPDGYVEVKDRAKDMIISGGGNISSLEVENGVYLHPAVLEVAVVAREDVQWVESPCAFISVNKSFEGSNKKDLMDDIMKIFREKMPPYRVPKSMVFGSLPKTATGKVQKNVLRSKVKEMGHVRKNKM